MAVPAPFAFAEFDIAVPVRWGFVLELLGLMVGLVVLIVLGVAVALKSRASIKTDDDPMPENSLANYQDLLDKGLLDPKEFERIRARLIDQPPAPPSGP